MAILWSCCTRTVTGALPMAEVCCQLGRAGKLGHSFALALLKFNTSGLGSENTIILTATNMIQAKEYPLLISASSSLAGH